MIEVQLDKQLYDTLSVYAGYHSDITHVCAFNDRMRNMLIAAGVELDNVISPDGQNAVVTKPSLTVVNRNVMKILNATPEMLHFLGIRSEFDTTISVRDMHQVHLLVKNHLVDVDDKFKELYGKMGYRDKINDLVCANIKFRDKGKLADHIDGTLSIQSMHFNQAKSKKLEYRVLHLEVVVPKNETTSLVEDGRTVVAHLMQLNAQGTRNGVGFKARFHIPCNVLRSIFVPGNRVHLATNKIIGTENDQIMVVNDPIILPAGLLLHEDEFISPPDRSIPADLYRYAWWEFCLRYEGYEENAKTIT